MNIDDLYRLGLWIQRMRDCMHAVVKGERSLVAGLQNIERILKENKIGSRCVGEISKWEVKLNSKYTEEKRIEEEDALELSRDADNWNEEMHRDLRQKHIVEMELQSGLNPRELLKMAKKESSEFIQAETWKELTDIEKSDFSDAARCLLLGTATPSVMVALRGAEASIRNFYYCRTKEEPGNKTWRQLLHELKNKAEAMKIEDTFIGYLDYFGDAKRNFAQHPNKVYSVREAVVVFMQVMGLVEDIYAQILQINAKKDTRDNP